jgi:hypothetical protein
MRKLIAPLIALAVLAGVTGSVNAQPDNPKQFYEEQERSRGG